MNVQAVHQKIVKLRWLPLLVLLISFSFNVLLYRHSVELTLERQQTHFDFRVREVIERIENRMATYQQVLRGVAGLFDTHASVSRQVFREYAERQLLAEYFPGIQGLGYATALAPEQLQTHISAVRAEGYTLAELQPISITTWLRLTHPDDLANSERLLKQYLAGETDHYECEARMRHKDGHWVWILDRGMVGKWNDEGLPQIMYGTHQDITLGRQQMEAYQYAAHHDRLTGLPNRMLLGDRLSQALALAEREKKGVALMYMDLDGFKLVNDNHGHDDGDLVLQVAANRILQCIRTADTLARVGGDEFVLLLQDVMDEQDALKVANTINSRIREPIPLSDGSQALVSLSIGIAIYPQHGTTADLLSLHADEAMYQVKRNNKNGACVYESNGKHEASPNQAHASSF